MVFLRLSTNIESPPVLCVDTTASTTMDKPFPRAFREEVKVIMKRLFRVFAHLYVHHFHRIQELQEEAHLNAAFKHFLFFVEEFDLIEKKELLPLAELIEKFTGKKVA
eukprot:TRINITY_DN6953_c0_g1_i17.p1 TRINITY_DN6953_c0_g1~~TRINITY_DN6953_c0_g1_i17.p1  ORF type:complete len:108 (+),score=22.03 TRINITY_DN6953_c0_g1_i17:280-603(+)